MARMRELAQRNALRLGPAHYKWKRFITLSNIEEARKKITAFIQNRYNITIVSTPIFKGVLSYGGLPTFSVLGIYDLKTGRMSMSWWSLFMCTKKGAEAVALHEIMHHLQVGSSLHNQLMSCNSRETHLASLAVIEGMAREIENKYSKEQHHGEKTHPFGNGIRYAVGYVAASLSSPIRLFLDLVGRLKKYKNMRAHAKITFMERHPNLMGLVFNPYKDGEQFVKCVIEKFGPEIAFRILLDTPPTTLDEIFRPSYYTMAMEGYLRSKEKAYGI